MKKVLIVDDSTFLRLSLKTMLEKNGFEVIGEAINGQDAKEKYIKLRPDIVTMDITMEGVNGIDGIKLIREIDPNAKIVTISSMGQESYVRKAVLAGATNFIVKPFKEEHIIRVLNSI